MIPDFTGAHLWERLSWAAENLPRVETDLVVVFEDDPDGTAKVLIPAPEWMACALAGGILPPVERYHAEPRDAAGNFTGPADYWRAYDAMPAMSEEEAIEYLIAKDMPRHVWDRPAGSNYRPFVICRRDQLPATRSWRDAWKLAA